MENEKATVEYLNLIVAHFIGTVKVLAVSGYWTI